MTRKETQRSWPVEHRTRKTHPCSFATNISQVLGELRALALDKRLRLLHDWGRGRALIEVVPRLLELLIVVLGLGVDGARLALLLERLLVEDVLVLLALEAQLGRQAAGTAVLHVFLIGAGRGHVVQISHAVGVRVAGKA